MLSKRLDHSVQQHYPRRFLERPLIASPSFTKQDKEANEQELPSLA